MYQKSIFDYMAIYIIFQGLYLIRNIMHGEELQNKALVFLEVGRWELLGMEMYLYLLTEKMTKIRENPTFSVMCLIRKDL